MVVIAIFDNVIGTVVSEVWDGVAEEGDHSEKRVKKNNSFTNNNMLIHPSIHPSIHQTTNLTFYYLTSDELLNFS